MKKLAKLLSLCLVLALLFTGCGNNGNGGNTDGPGSNSEIGGNNSQNDSNGNQANGNNGSNSSNNNDKDDSSTSQDPVAPDFAEKEDDMITNRDTETDYKENGSIAIQLNGNSATCKSNKVNIDGSIITIKDEGTYIISGTLKDGTIVVNAQASDKPQLVLDGASINSSTSAPIYILEADKVFITLADGTKNTLSSGDSFSPIDGHSDSSSIDGTLFSKQDLTLNGSGSLTITSPAGHGIVCKDDLVFTSGTYSITSASHGIDANDSFRMKDASITIEAGKDGVHVENSDDASKGFIYLLSGTLSIEAEGDGMSSSYYTQVEGGSTTILSGDGYENGTQHSSDNWGDFGGGMGKPGGAPPDGERPSRPGRSGASSDTSNTPATYTSNTTTTTDDGSTSMKGIKSNSSLLINDGTITIDSADDGIHSNLSVYINGGNITIASGDDGIHGEEELIITGGTINITQSYEGLEGLDITISGGDIDMQCTDDGINAAGGNDASGAGGRDQMFGGPGGGMSAGNGSVVISGGDIFMYAKGDGIDANGTLEISGGKTIVTGPTQGDTAVLDYDKTATITGGIFIGVGSTMMAQSFSNGTQGTLAAQGSFSGGTKISVTDASGNEIVSFTPETAYQYIVISTPDIQKVQSYTMSVGTSSTTLTAK